MLHGYDLAVRAELHIERALRTIKHRIPLDLSQILHGFAAVGAGGIFRVLHPVGKAADGVHILAGRAVKQGHRRFAQHKGIFREGLVVLGTDIAIRLLRPVKELGGKDFHSAIQGKTVKGWTFDKEGQRIRLGFDTCYPMVKGTTGEKSPVRIGRAREDTCPHCGGRMVDILVLDGRDERLRFLGLDGILTATCCPSCVGFLKGPAFNRFALDGGVEVFPSELFDGAEKTDCYVSPEEYKALTENPFVLGEAPVSLFYGAACQDVNTIGGFGNWVQDAEYATCPHCGKPMKYLAQIQWDTVFDCAEGTLYVEFCSDCQIVSMQHQQT